LLQGIIAGVGLDVLDEQPLPFDIPSDRVDRKFKRYFCPGVYGSAPPELPPPDSAAHLCTTARDGPQAALCQGEPPGDAAVTAVLQKISQRVIRTLRRRGYLEAGSTLSPLERLERLAALVPLPRVHLVRYAGCLAPHSKLWDAVIPTPHQQGYDVTRGLGGDVRAAEASLTPLSA